MKFSNSTKSLKSRTIYAILWSAVQKYGALAISFISNIVLARLLTPNDFGLIGILTIFIAIATSLTESGFNSALIQRKDTTDIDYNTVFYWNLAISICLVTILYFLSPLIADYFNQPDLCNILRAESIILIINSFCIVQTTRLMKFLRFKILAIRTILASLISACVGIILALNGYGVWSLVWQGIVSSIVGAVLLWSSADWRPKLQYSWSSFNRMFKFGAYIAVSSVCNTLYINLQSFLIGKSFSISDLGYYTQAKKLETVPVDGTASVLNAVLFPVYSSISHDRRRHRLMVRKNVNILTFFTFPLMSMLIIVAPYLFRILFTNKWDDSIPMFQILCVYGMFTPLNMANVEIFRAIGEGKIYLVLQTLKRLIGVGIILLFVRYGLYPLLWAIVAFGIITYILNIIFTHRNFGYSYRNQLYDIIPNLSIAILVYVFSESIVCFFDPKNSWTGLFLGGLSYVFLYIGISMAFKLKGIKLIKSILSSNKPNKIQNKPINQYYK